VQRACDLGYADGCAKAGQLYVTGDAGVGPDYARAFKLYKRACDGGSVEGCAGEGVLLIEGAGTERDGKRGLALLRGACSQGDQQSCEAAKEMAKEVR